MHLKVALGLYDIRPDGMGRAAVVLMRALRAQGVEVVPVHTCRHVDFAGYEAEFHPLFLSEEENPPVQTILRAMVETVNSLPGATHFLHFGQGVWGCALPYLRAGLQVVVSVHSTNPSSLKIAGAYAPRVAAFVGVSPGVARRFARRLPAAERGKVRMIPNSLLWPAQPKQDYTTGAPFRLCYLGRIENQSKGCGKLPRIVRELKRRGCAVRLDLYGRFCHYEAEFRALVARCGVEQEVQVRGELPPEAVAEVLKGYDAMIAPSNFEGFGLSLLEAMALGVPCIASRLPEVTTWMVEEGRSGLLVEKTDLAGFATAVETLQALSPEARAQMGQAARARAFALASPEAHGQAYRALLEETLGSAAGSVRVRACALEQFRGEPGALKPWLPARILPERLKASLRRFMR